MDKRTIFTPEFVRENYDFNLFKGLLIKRINNKFLPIYKTRQSSSYVAAYARLSKRINSDTLYYNANYGAVVYCWCYGSWPIHVVDHINNDTLNNLPWNLRDVTQRENSQNKINNNKGVYWNKRLRKWQAQIRIQGAKVYLGLHSSIQEAQLAYKTACEANGIPYIY